MDVCFIIKEEYIVINNKTNIGVYTTKRLKEMGLTNDQILNLHKGEVSVDGLIVIIKFDDKTFDFELGEINTALNKIDYLNNRDITAKEKKYEKQLKALQRKLKKIAYAKY